MLDGGFGQELSHWLLSRIGFFEQKLESLFDQLFELSLRVFVAKPILKGSVHGHHFVISRKDKLGTLLRQRFEHLSSSWLIDGFTFASERSGQSADGIGNVRFGSKSSDELFCLELAFPLSQLKQRGVVIGGKMRGKKAGVGESEAAFCDELQNQRELPGEPGHLNPFGGAGLG